MATYDIYEVEDDNVECLIRVEFSKSGPRGSLLDAVAILTKVLRRGIAANRFEELVSLELTSDYCELRLLYFTTPKREKMGLGRSGYDDVLGIWFERYVIANLDSVIPIEDHPFHGLDLSLVRADPAPFDTDPDPD